MVLIRSWHLTSNTELQIQNVTKKNMAEGWLGGVFIRWNGTVEWNNGME